MMSLDRYQMSITRQTTFYSYIIKLMKIVLTSLDYKLNHFKLRRKKYNMPIIEKK